VNDEKQPQKSAVKPLVAFRPAPDVAEWLESRKAQGVTYTHSLNAACRKAMETSKP
jgi:uncharacterized protein (DUF4415 family)